MKKEALRALVSAMILAVEIRGEKQKNGRVDWSNEDLRHSKIDNALFFADQIISRAAKEQTKPLKKSWFACLKRPIMFSLFILIPLLFTSCEIESQLEYEKKFWEYKTKQLELDYIKQLNQLERDAVNAELRDYVKSLKYHEVNVVGVECGRDVNVE